MSATTATAPVVIPPEVTAFAAEKGASEYLPKFVELAQKLFTGLPITVELNQDPELSYNRTILFRVVAPDWDDERYFQTKDNWYSESANFCPATHFHVFGLIIRSH